MFDTNVLIYAIDTDSAFHDPCRVRLREARDDPAPPFLTVVDPLRLSLFVSD